MGHLGLDETRRSLTLGNELSRSRVYEMSTLDLFRHDFVLSIRPEYATKIMSGEEKESGTTETISVRSHDWLGRIHLNGPYEYHMVGVFAGGVKVRSDFR
jgi:hypothetical protein